MYLGHRCRLAVMESTSGHLSVGQLLEIGGFGVDMSAYVVDGKLNKTRHGGNEVVCSASHGYRYMPTASSI
ncbi:hypothetical protein LZ30DRAFT_710156 [Colletotrichum cereale]|nr:hypothetical protein LZ30DRAFT_710156 [Colletotrichum cereale]